MSGIRIIVDDSAMLATFERVERGLDSLIEQAAELLAEEAANAGGSVSSRLAAPWDIAIAGDTATVTAPEWWARFPADGTGPHGPARARVMVIDGDFAQYVRGEPATHFDEAAAEATRGRIDELLIRLMGSAT